MRHPQFKRDLAIILVLAAVYFVAGKLGLRLAFLHASATPVWPPAGIALAAFLFLGYRVWPGVFFGAFLVNLTTAGSAATSVGIAAGNTLEGLIGAYLINRFAHGRDVLNRAHDIFRFTVLAALLSTTIGATLGVTSLAVGGYAPWNAYQSIWLTWWLGDAAGDLVVAPVLLLWGARPRLRWNRSQVLEATALLLGIILVGESVFGPLSPAGLKNYPMAFLCIPFLIWAAFRFGQREAATAILVFCGIAIWNTLHGLGPFVRESKNESLLILQAFMGVMTLTSLALAAVVSEHKGVEEALRKAHDELVQLATSDPLTGLANYRRLIDVLDAEIQRSLRTERPFAILLLDLDGLKKVNDNYGHLMGSRALCRLAEVLRVHCRAIDMAARYGGDEFVVVLPETGAKAARQVALRISKRLSQDHERPPISVSIGEAVYPEDGETIEKLLSAADIALYRAKTRAPHKLSLRK